MKKFISIVTAIFIFSISANANAYSLNECRNASDAVNSAIKSTGPIKSEDNTTVETTYCFEDKGGVATAYKYKLNNVSAAKLSADQVLKMKTTMKEKIRKFVCSNSLAMISLEKSVYDRYEYYSNDELLYSFKIQKSDCQ